MNDIFDPAHVADEALRVLLRAEQAVIGSLLANNDALDRAGHLSPDHFYRHDHRIVFEELQRQIGAGRRADAITIAEKLSSQVDDCLPYLAKLRHNCGPGAHQIRRHADIVVDGARKRSLMALGAEMMGAAGSPGDVAEIIDGLAAKLEALAQSRVDQEPQRMADMMPDYALVVQGRNDGQIVPISTGWRDLDEQLDGGLERGTLAVVAGRPSMGKTAFGLGIARNVAAHGVSLFLSMEMARNQVNDRNVSAIGHIPLKWLKRPAQDLAAGEGNWTAMAEAFKKAQALNLYIDDQTGLNILQIRAKARRVQRKAKGLDVLVVDQLSFITGGKGDKWELTGEYTRALVALAKELNCAVVLLCQLNRKCEERPNKRPMLSDLAQSGSIEQDAAMIVFLYRDEVYNADTQDKGLCEVNVAKSRQGEPGMVRMTYIGAQTRFENLARNWTPRLAEPAPSHHGFD